MVTIGTVDFSRCLLWPNSQRVLFLNGTLTDIIIIIISEK